MPTDAKYESHGDGNELPGYHKKGDGFFLFPQLLQQCKTIHIGHDVVGYNTVKVTLTNHGQGLSVMHSRDHFVTRIPGCNFPTDPVYLQEFFSDLTLLWRL